MRYLKIFWAIFSLLMSFLFLTDYMAYLENPLNYPIGENMHWEYQSEWNFKTSCWVLFSWFLGGISPILWRKKQISNKIFLFHFSITLIYFLNFFYRFMQSIP